MRKTFAIGMIVIMMLPGLQQLGIFIDFKVHQDFIAKMFCINKDEPITICQGKCYLFAKLNQENERQQAPPYQEDRLEVTHYILGPAFHFTKITEPITCKSSPSYLPPLYSFACLTDMFRPPQVHLYTC